MVKTYYKASPETPPALSVVTVSGSVSQKTGTKSFWLQYRTFAGHSQVSPRVDIAIAVGRGASITIPGAALPSPSSACHIAEYLVLMAESTDPMTACVVASQSGFSVSGAVQTPPFTLSLTTDEHFQISKVIATPDLLPTGGNLVNGMRRSVDSLGKIRCWVSAIASWQDANPQVFNTFVADDELNLGSRMVLGAFSDTSIILTPDYASDSGTPSSAVGFWIENDSVTTIDKGTRIAFSVEIDGLDVSSLPGIVGGLELTFQGYVNVTTGTLDTSGEGGAGTMPGVGTPIPYQGLSTGLTLQKALPPGYAYVISVRATFTTAQLNNRAMEGDIIGFEPKFFADFAIFNPIGEALGSLILPNDQRRRIVPTFGLQAIALGGKGQVIYPGGGAFVFPARGSQIVPGLQANQSNQKVAINIAGTCLVVPLLTPDVQLRAIVGTLDGMGQASGWKGAIALASNKLLTMQITYNKQIRLNYPDRIAGYTGGDFNAYKLHIYVRPVGGGAVTRFEGLVNVGAATQVFTIGTVAGASMGTTPSLDRPSPDFGLYDPVVGDFVLNNPAGASVFASGNYEVALRFEFKNSVTSVQHSPALGCIPELESDLVGMSQQLLYWASPVATPPDLDALATERKIDGQMRIVQSLKEPFVYRAPTNSWAPLRSPETVNDEAELRSIPAPITPWKQFFIKRLLRQTYFDPAMTGAETGTGIFKPYNLLNSEPGRHVLISKGR